MQYAKNSTDKHRAGVNEENTVLDSYLAKIEEKVPGSSGTNPGGDAGETVITGEAIGTNAIKIGDLVYVINDDNNKKAKVVGYRGETVTDYTMMYLMTAPSMTATEIDILSKVKIGENEYTVDTIGASAFSYMGETGATSITKVDIPNTITTIISGAFAGCTGIIEFNVDTDNANYTSENGKLFNKDKTTLIQYPAGKLDESYSMPSTVNSLEPYAFHSCSNLRSITISNGVTSIGDTILTGCTGLTTITIPKTVTSIDANAFSYCTALTTVNYTGTVEEWGNISIGEMNENLTNATINYAD